MSSNLWEPVKLEQEKNDLLKARKYYHDGETEWEHLSRRVAKAISINESDWEEKFFELISTQKFIPSSPTLMNADAINGAGLSSCFIIDIKDSVEEIFLAQMRSAKIFQYNGGVGFDISPLRPSQAELTTAKGAAGGPVAFMHSFNAVAESMTKNNSRKSATKIDMQVWHPDIYEFIHCKDDGISLPLMNISVSIPDRFMEAVKNNDDWNLVFPDYKSEKDFYNAHWDGDLDKWLEDGHGVKIYKTVKAVDLYHEICESAWKRGDPGVIFTDSINKKNPNNHVGKVNSSNPSLVSGTKVLTNEGIFEIQELEGKEFFVPSMISRNSPATCFLSGENQEIIEFTLVGGRKVKSTLKHKWPIREGGWVVKKESKDIIVGDEIPSAYPRKTLGFGDKGTRNEGFLVGWLYGDGSICIRSDNGKTQYGLIFSQEDKDNGILDKVLTEVSSITGEKYNPVPRNQGRSSWYETHIISNAFHEKMMSFGVLKKENGLPIKIWNELSDDFRAGFLDGIFSSDGYVSRLLSNDSGCMKLTQSREKLILDIQKLLGFYGINGSLQKTTTKNARFPNGKIYNKECIKYDLRLSTHAVCVLREIVTELSHLEKNKKMQGVKNLSSHLSSGFSKVIKIESVGVADKVWDLTVFDESHSFVIDTGTFTGNCAEFNSIPYSSCCLGSFNLLKYIELANGDMNIVNSNIEKDMKTVVRFLDNVISLNKFPFKEIEQVTKANRSIGIGLMGLADSFYCLKIPYGSKKARFFTEDLFANLTRWAQTESQLLAEERGCYSNYAGSDWDKKGIKVRNSDFTSCAPTGSISFFAGVSSGIEPNFALVYTRTTNEGNKYKISNRFFQKELEERGVFNESILTKISENHGSCQGIEEIPEDIREIFVVSHDLSPKQHIDITAATQENISLSVSKTVNLSNDATIEEVKDTYRYAFEKGVLGITVYRDGCRDSQVLSVEKKEVVEKNLNTLQWGDVVPANDDVVGRKKKIRTACGNLHLTAFFDEQTGKMVEVFTNRGGQGGCTALQSTVSRLISRNLRLGDTPEKINEQLQSTLQCPHWQAANLRRAKEGKEPLAKGFSCASAIGSALVEMGKEMSLNNKVEEGIKKNERNCPDCQEILSQDGGCLTCKSCGWSKCT